MVSYCDATSPTGAWGSWTASTCDCGASDTWPMWIAVDPAYTTTDNTVWTTWASDGTSSTGNTTITTDATWDTWVVADYGRVEVVPDERYEARFQQTQAELEAESKRRKDAEKKAEEAIAAQEQAEKKAKELLEDLIGEDQLKVYEQTGRLLVHGRKYDYLLERSGGVRRFEKDKVVDLCIHLVDKFKMPDTDNIISLKLLAEADEKGFNELANTIRSGSAEELPEAACA